MLQIWSTWWHDEEGLRARTEAREELDAELEKLRLEKLKAVMASEEAKEALNQAELGWGQVWWGEFWLILFGVGLWSVLGLARGDEMEGLWVGLRDICLWNRQKRKRKWQMNVRRQLPRRHNLKMFQVKLNEARLVADFQSLLDSCTTSCLGEWSGTHHEEPRRFMSVERSRCHEIPSFLLGTAVVFHFIPVMMVPRNFPVTGEELGSIVGAAWEGWAEGMGEICEVPWELGS